MSKPTKQTFFIFFLSCWISAFLFGGGLCIYIVAGFFGEPDVFNWSNWGILPIAVGLVIAVFSDTKYKLIRAQLDD